MSGTGHDGDLAWGAFERRELHELADRYGTPFYLYDADAVCARIRLVRDAFDGLVQVYYAVKANPNLELLRAVRETADGLDISSGGELDQSCLAGYDPGRLSFAGPGKSVAELEASISRGVGCISAESVQELEECAAIARRLDRAAHIALRVNPLLKNRAFGLKMGGRPVQFGIDEEQLEDAVAVIARQTGRLRFRGVHVYAGSQCFEPAGVAEGVLDTIRIAREVEARLGQPCATVNFGGGFGVSHTEGGREIDVPSAARELVPALRDFQFSGGASRKLVFELGRYLTAHAGLYVCRVLRRKESRGKSFVVVDGGLHHHLTAAGTFGAALRSNFILQNLTRPDAPPTRCSVAGPSCNPTDLLGVDVELAALETGDLLGVLKSGSYGLTASPILFLGRRTAAELVRSAGEVRVGRAARGILDFN